MNYPYLCWRMMKSDNSYILCSHLLNNYSGSPLELSKVLTVISTVVVLSKTMLLK